MENKKKNKIRHDKIRSLLLTHDRLRLQDFCTILNCSESTIRNDLRQLEAEGYLRRTFGGAVATGSTSYNIDISTRSNAFVKEKTDIADYIVSHFLGKPDLTIILDSGSTNLILAQKIVEADLKINVITNSFSATAVLSQSNQINVYLTGGLLNKERSSFHDELAGLILNSFWAEYFFLGINGISSDAGYTMSGNEETVIKQNMMKRSQKTIALADHSKIGKIGFMAIANLEDVNILVTDSSADKKEIMALSAKGADVHIAGANE